MTVTTDSVHLSVLNTILSTLIGHLFRRIYMTNKVYIRYNKVHIEKCTLCQQ